MITVPMDSTQRISSFLRNWRVSGFGGFGRVQQLRFRMRRFGFDIGVAFRDALYVFHGLEEGWHAVAVLIDAFGSGVVGGQGQGQVVVILSQKQVTVVGSRVHVFLWIENVFYPKLRSRLRNQLHQAARVFARDGFGIEV